MKTKQILTMMMLLVVSIFLIQHIAAVDETIFTGDYKIDYSYFDASEGETFTLTVTITNKDSVVKNEVFFEIDDKNPFDVDRDDREWDIGTLGIDESVTNTFRVDVDEDTSEGKYNLDFMLEDKDDDFNDEFEIEVNSDKADLIIGSVSSSPSIIAPDQEDVELRITLNNIGGGNATFVRVKLELPDGLSSSNSFSDSVSLGTIENGDSSEAVFFIDTEKTLESGIHTARLILDFKSDSNEETSTLSFEIPVKGKPLFNILSSWTNPSSVAVGGSGQLNIDIQNVGEEEGKETSVRVFENADQPFNFDEKTNFVGNLKTGESGVATFVFDVDSNANPNSYLVRVQVRTLSRDNIIVSDYTVPVTVSEAKKGFFSNWYVLAVGLIILIGLIYGGARVLGEKRNKKN